MSGIPWKRWSDEDPELRGEAGVSEISEWCLVWSEKWNAPFVAYLHVWKGKESRWISDSVGRVENVTHWSYVDDPSQPGAT